MHFRKVGNWPLEVSEIALGTGDTAGGIIYGSTKEQRALVENALDLGVNLFDCSPDYGKGMGEGNLGRVLKELGPVDAKIITKVEIMPEDFGRIREKIEESINDSLLRLQRDHVDVLMLHNPVRLVRDAGIRVWMRLTPADVMEQVLPALQDVRSAGKTRFLGLACESSEAAAVRPLLETREFAIINAWYNLANPTASVPIKGFDQQHDYQGLFDLADMFGAGIAVIRPLAGGALTDAFLKNGREARHELSRGYYRENPELLEPEIDRARRFDFLRHGGERTLSEAAYRYIFSDPRVSTIIGGFSDIGQMKDAATASDKGPLDAADAGRVAEIHRAGFRG